MWTVEPSQRLDPSSTGFTALVSRLACNSGVTGEVYAPKVQVGEDEIIVTFSVAPTEGAQSCPSNDLVPHRVDLGEPLGDRSLVDGQCRPGAKASTTSFCLAGSARYTP